MEGDDSSQYLSHLVPNVGENSEWFTCSLCFEGGIARPKNKQLLHIKTHYSHAYVFHEHVMVMEVLDPILERVQKWKNRQITLIILQVRLILNV